MGRSCSAKLYTVRLGRYGKHNIAWPHQPSVLGEIFTWEPAFKLYLKAGYLPPQGSVRTEQRCPSHRILLRNVSKLPFTIGAFIFDFLPKMVPVKISELYKFLPLPCVFSWNPVCGACSLLCPFITTSSPVQGSPHQEDPLPGIPVHSSSKLHFQLLLLRTFSDHLMCSM